MVSGSTRRGLWPRVAQLAGLGGVYLASGIFCQHLSGVLNTVPMIWAPAGIALGLLVRWGPDLWPGLLLGSLLLSLIDGHPLGVSAVFAAGQTIAIAGCSYALRRIPAFRTPLDSRHSVFLFLGLGVVGCSLAATVLSELVPPEVRRQGGPAETWSVHWAGTAFGILLFAPLLLIAREERLRQLASRRRLGEQMVVFGGIVGSSVLVFDPDFGAGSQHLPLTFVPFLFLAWEALRFGALGSVLGALIVAHLTLSGTARGAGPFAGEDPAIAVVVAWSYIGVIGTSSLLLAAMDAERTASERELRESEARYRAIVEQSSDMICRFNESGALTYVNPAFCDYLGCDRTQALGTAHHALEGQEETFATLRPRMPTLHHERSWPGHGGKTRWSLWATGSILDDHGRFLEYQSVGRDITERKEMEQALRHTQTRLRQVLDLVPHAIYAKDSSGRFLFANLAAAKEMDTTPEALIGRTHPEMLRVPEDALPLLDDDRHVISSGEALFVPEARITGHDGQVRTVEITRVPMPVEGDPQPAVLCIAIDVTDRLKSDQSRQILEAQLLQAQKMESIGRLAGGVAHDFNNLLTIIQGNASMAIQEPHAERTRERLKEISESAERAADLTRQLLLFSRRHQVKMELVDLQELVNRVSRMLRRLIGEDIALEIDPSSHQALVEADKGMIEQVLLNLAVNARDAMPGGGRMRIHTGLAIIDRPEETRHPEARSGRFAVLIVRDTGMGIPATDQERIFEPFFTTKEPGKGTGLGLSIVYGIVKQHHGWIEVESEPRRGATFRIYLPANPEKGVTGAERTVTPPTRGAETLLLVEDDPGVRTLVRRMLESLGYHVFEAGSAADAFTIWELHRRRIQLILADVVLPGGVSGPVLADRLRREKPSLKVLLTSGHGESILANAGVLIEGARFIGKPYRVKQLGDAVRACLDQV